MKLKELEAELQPLSPDEDIALQAKINFLFGRKVIENNSDKNVFCKELSCLLASHTLAVARSVFDNFMHKLKAKKLSHFPSEDELKEFIFKMMVQYIQQIPNLLHTRIILELKASPVNDISIYADATANTEKYQLDNYLEEKLRNLNVEFEAELIAYKEELIERAENKRLSLEGASTAKKSKNWAICTSILSLLTLLATGYPLLKVFLR